MTIQVDRRLVLGGLGSLAALLACRSSDKAYDAEVIILGAGLSGLHAARLLEAESKDVLVLEGSGRIGGRMHTLDHGALGYTEGGGEQVGASYARIIDSAKTLGLKLTPDKPQRRDTAYYYDGKLMGPDEWKTLDPHPFADPFKEASPGSPLFALAAKDNPLTAPQDWRDPQFSAYDISAEDFLKSKGFSDEARRVIGVALNGNSLESYSMMNLYRSLQLYAAARGMGPSLSIEGGAQRLPEAMAKSLKRPVMTGQMISQIEAQTDSVSVTTNTGKTYRALHCICTLPFSALRHITLNAALPTPQSDAVNRLPYTQIYQVHFKANTRFWETDGLPADMWTDSPVERVFASLNSTGKPTGLFRAWTNGSAANMWAANEDPQTLIQSEFKRVRPSSKGDIDILGIANWTVSNPLAGGAYMHWAPGQIPAMAETMGQPARRLSFAGEHLGYLHTGMEAAMESAENAAFALMDI